MKYISKRRSIAIAQQLSNSPASLRSVCYGLFFAREIIRTDDPGRAQFAMSRLYLEMQLQKTHGRGGAPVLPGFALEA